MNLTDEEIRIKVAEAHGTMRWSYALPTKCIGASVPNYPEDLNAMHEAEKMLTDEQQRAYVLELGKVCGVHGFKIVSSTARQRCLAYLKTKRMIP